jgi:hypothetical protein
MLSASPQLILHVEAGQPVNEVTLERKQFDVTINWSAQVDGETFSKEEMGKIEFAPEKKSAVFVETGFGIANTNRLGLSGLTDSLIFHPLQSNSVGSIVSNPISPLISVNPTGLASSYSSVTGATGLFGTLDPYRTFQM